ncbi:Acg family FMN-binding oxidoreductase [Niallia sp. 03133]|uniref:Acg family FMN-binding oxidoreductase n=1 Tax=Niallia sp. 03133 TaxID=3458060 RepID=UPI004043EAAA
MKKVKRKISFLTISLSVLLVIVFSTILIASGAFLTPKYLEPWKKNYSAQFDDPRVNLASQGLLAASGHNMQPWIIRLDKENPNVFYLYADSKKLVQQVDPYARQTLISQGTFLEYVKIAGAEHGYDVGLDLFPEGEYDERNIKESMKLKPVAKVTLKKVEGIENVLYPYLFLMDTNRFEYENTTLTDQQIKQLNELSDKTGITIKIFQDHINVKNLGRFAIDGAKIESKIHRINIESGEIFRANEYKKNKYRYGFSVEGQGITGMKKHLMQGLLTLIPSMNNEKASADLFVKSTQIGVNHTPVYAMIMTKDNSRSNQVKAGMIYSRLVLTAHSIGFVMQPPSQVLEEYPEMKEQNNKIHREYALHGETIQMFVRMGKPTKEAPKSMRQDVREFIQ